MDAPQLPWQDGKRERVMAAANVGPFRLLILVAAGLAFVSCRSTSARYRFTPSPLEALVQFEEGGPVAARILIGIPGAEREGGSTSGHPELLVRVRVENKSDGPMSLHPSSAVLLGSDLAEFGPAKSDTPPPLEVPSGGSDATLLRFPFPRNGDLDAPGLTGVNLAFVLETTAGPVDMSVSLERDEPRVLVGAGPPQMWGGGFYWGNRWGPWGRW